MALIVVLGIAVVILSDEAEAVTSISLTIQGSDTQSVTPGSSATFKINVTNTLTTTTLTVNLTRSTPPTYWTAQLSQSQISVSPLATKSVTLTVGVPGNASADPVGKQIIVTADPDFGDTEQITTTTKVSQTYGIQTSSATTLKSTVGGSAVSFVMQINNTGNGQDTVNVTHSGQPSSWTVSHVSSVTVPAGGTRTVTITVVPPSSAAAGTYQTTVKAASSDGTKNDQTTFIIIITKQYGLTLSSSDVSKYVTPNVAAYYNMSVTNTGNTADSAQISIVNPPGGWTVLPTSNPVSLSPNQTKDFRILVTAPSSVLSGTQVKITINATSNGNASIVRQLSINAVVNQVYDPRVTPQTNNKVVAPGTSVTFKVNCSNNGNGNDTVDLSLSGVPTGQGWVYNFNPVSVSLTPGQTRTVDLTFTIGAKAAYGDNLVTVIGTSHGTTTTGTTNVIVSVSQYYNLALVPLGASTKRVDPGGSLDFDLQVTNTGNGPDDITFASMRIDGSWVSYFSKTTIYNLPANSTDTSVLTIEIPSTTNAGTYRFDVRATSSGNGSVSRTVYNLTIIVNQLFSVDIEPVSLFASGDPGASIRLNVTVTNDGSGKDNVTLSVPGQYSSWVSFNRTTVALNPGASTLVAAIITPPAGTAAGDVTITLRGTSKGRTTVYDEASVTVTVNKVYAAKLSAVELTLNRKPTETAVFTVRVKNDGNTADTFKVNFTSNPRNLASHSLPSPYVTLGAGNTRTFTVTVTVPSGEPVGNLRFRLLATSDNNTAATSTVTLTVTVDPVHGVDLFSYDPTASAEPTDSDTVELRVANTGNGQDTFALRAIGPNYRWVSFESSQVTVSASGEVVVNMTITLPDTDVVSTGTYYINITATSAADGSVTKTLEIKVTVEHKEDLELTANDLIRRRSTDPGGSVTYTIKVENLGVKAHVVNMALSGTNSDWAKLNASLIIVPAGSSGLATVTVSVPEGTAPMSFDLVVTGTFDDNERRTDSFTVITTVNRVYGVTVELNDTTVSAPPGDAVTVVLNVNNTGNAQDTFDLEVDVNKAWVTFTPSSVTLAAGANANVTVRIVAPLDPLTPDGMQYMNVTAVSRGDKTVSSADMLEFEVEQVYAVKAKALPVRRSVDPGVNALYNITITNKGNGRDAFVLSLEGARKAWGRLSKTQVSLDAGAETIVVLTVRVPSNQPVEDALIIVNATSSGGDDVTAKATTTTTINAFFGVDLTVSNPSKPAFPGKWAAFKVKVKNTGNSQDTFNFDVTGDSAAWVATLDPVTIDPGKTKTIDFNLTPPLDVENGVYTFTLNASSDTQGDAWDELELEVDINVYHGLLVTLSETDIESRPGDTETVQVFVENTGNVNDTFDVRALGSYASWVTIDNLTLDADEGESAVATATIVVNATLSGNYKIRFEVTSRAGGNVSEAELTISIQLTYGVSMAPLKDDHPGAPDYNVTIEVELTNEGNIEDTFGLGTPQLPGSLWDATLDRNQLTVAGGGSGFFNVTVYIPDGVVAGDYVVRVKASSTKSPNVPKPSDTVLLNISIAFDVSATGPAGTISLYPEESRTVQVTVKNEGLGRDTIKLYIDDEEYKDWAVPAVTSVVLRAGQTALVDVAVSPPANALAGTYVIKLRAESGSDEDVYDIADTRVTVRQVYSVFVEPISSYLEGVAGIRHEVTLRVHNDGNGEDDISLYPIAPSGVDIEATLSRGTVTLAAHENITVILRIKADTDVEAGAHMIEVEARSRSSTVLPYRVTVTYEIPAYHEVSVLTSEGLESFTIGDATVGQTYQVTIEVFNLGNVVDTYNLFASSDDVDVPTWITFPTSDVTVDAGTSEVLIVDIGVPGSVMAGTYDLELVAKSSTANESAAVTGTIVIGQDRSVTLSALITTKTLDPTSTQGVTFDITVRNDGNVAESVSLEVTYPSGWQPPSIDPTTVTVPAYGTAMVKVTFSSSSAPSNAAATNAITAKGLYNNDNLESPLLNLVVDVLQPDVDVKSIVLKPPKPQQDDVVTVEITLENSGVVDATGLTVTLLVDGSPAGSQTNQQVKAGETKTVAMDWEVLAGAGDVLTLEVRIPQLDLTYQHPMPVTIDSGERSFFDRLTDLPFLTVVIMGLVIGLIIGLAIAGGVHKRGKKRLEAARAAGMAEGLTMADMEKAEEEGAEGILDDEEAEDEGGDEEGDEEGTEEDVVEEGDEEEVPPVTVQCPKCDTLNKVTTAQRPYEFRCEKCDALLRLSR